MTTGGVRTSEDAAMRDGDEVAFGGLVERYRRELRVHCADLLTAFGLPAQLT